MDIEVIKDKDLNYYERITIDLNKDDSGGKLIILTDKISEIIKVVQGEIEDLEINKTSFYPLGMTVVKIKPENPIERVIIISKDKIEVAVEIDIKQL